MSLEQQPVGEIQLPRRQRRSSLLQLYAAKEGIQLNGNGSSILRGLVASLSLQQNAAQLSNNEHGAGRSATKSGIPTPLRSAVRSRVIEIESQISSGTRGRGASVSGSMRGRIAPVSAIRKGRGSIPVSTSVSRQPSNCLELSSNLTFSGLRIPVSRGQGQSVAPVTGHFGNNQNQLRRAPAQLGQQKTVGRSLLQSMRRSTSLDASAWSNSMMTPLNQGRSMMSTRSPLSLRRYGSATDISKEKGKTLIAPNGKDVKILNDMTSYVLKFLNDYGYPKVPTKLQDMKQISSNTYLDMVRFVSKYLVGTKFFVHRQKDPKEDHCSKILELTNAVKYPGTISKSHLKSVNAQHSWPTCITFLTWLCIRVREGLENRNENSQIDFLKGFTKNKIALPNYLELFSIVKSNVPEDQQHDEFQKKFQRGIQEFRKNLAETVMSEVQSSTEELMAQKVEKLAQLAELKAQPDPSKDAFEAVKNAKIMFEETAKKKCEVKNRVATYQNVSLLKTKIERLKLEINSREWKIESIKKEVSKQLCTKEEAEKLVEETIDFKNQRECLHVILAKLRNDLGRKKQLHQNLEQRFREIISKFTVVETFNATLYYLKLEDFSVPANPLNANDLNEWLDKVKSIHERTDEALHTLMEAVKNDLVKQKDVELKTDQELAMWSEKETTIKSQLKTTQKSLTTQENLFQKDKEGKIAHLSTITQNNEMQEAMTAELQRSLSLKSQELQTLKITKRKKEECSKAWNASVCEWSDGLLYAETANAQHIKESLEEVVEKAREYMRMKTEAENKSEDMISFEVTARGFLSDMSVYSQDIFDDTRFQGIPDAEEITLA